MSRGMLDRNEPSESSPLLSQNLKEDHIIRFPALYVVKTPRSILLLLFLVVALLECGENLMQSPQTRIIESVICYRWYEKSDPGKLWIAANALEPGAIGQVPEMLCKVDPVQSQLAMLKGWQQLFNSIPNLILAVPFGWAADKFGRKLFVMLGLISFPLRAAWIQIVTWYWQAFDVRASWLSALLGSLGGGNTVLTALIFASIADVVLQEERTSFFLRLGAADLIAGLVVPPLSVVLMQITPWLPCLGGTALEVFVLLLYTMVPETLNFRNADSLSKLASSTTQTETLMPEGHTTAHETTSDDFPRSCLCTFRTSTAFLTRDWRVVALIMPFLSRTLIGSASQLLLQYISKRCALSLSKATLFLTIRAAMNTVMLLAILPGLSALVMDRWELDSNRGDLYLARASTLPMAIGWVLIALSPNIFVIATGLIVCSMGAGTFFLTKSFLTSLLPAHHVAKVYSIIGLVDTVGAMLGGPLLAWLFTYGIALGGGWTGLSFYFLGLTALMTGGLLYSVKVRRDEEQEEEGGDRPTIN